MHCLFLEDKCSFHTKRDSYQCSLICLGTVGCDEGSLNRLIQSLAELWNFPSVVQLLQGKLSFLETFKCTKGSLGQQKANTGVHSVKL